MTAPARRPLLAALGLAAALALAAACGREPALETRTFELHHLDPNVAAEIVSPYVYADRPGASGTYSAFPGGLTVRETRDNLDRIARVLDGYDRPRPGVALHFQLIRADGAGESDPRIAEVEAVLRDLFRFEGYDLLTEARMAAVEGGSANQLLQSDEAGSYFLSAHVRRVQGTVERGSVQIAVEFRVRQVGRAIATEMTVPAGQTVVLGSTRPDPGQGALILTLRPELVPMDDLR